MMRLTHGLNWAYLRKLAVLDHESRRIACLVLFVQMNAPGLPLREFKPPRLPPSKRRRHKDIENRLTTGAALNELQAYHTHSTVLGCSSTRADFENAPTGAILNGY